jgi:hypothetical protein
MAMKKSPKKRAKKQVAKKTSRKAGRSNAAPKRKPVARKKPAAKKQKAKATAAPRKVRAQSASTQQSEERSEVREIFSTYDRDGSGSIDRAELSRLLEALGSSPSEEELAIALDVVDANRSGKVSWREFIAWWNSR